MDKNEKCVVVVGASDKPERYAYQVLSLLRQHHWRVCPVHPRLNDIDGLQVYHSLSEVSYPVDTVTMYVNAARSADMARDLLMLAPKRVIFNPGSENLTLAIELTAQNIQVVYACTLVMLRTGQF